MPGEAAERPKLAQSTWLVGQLDESALVNPPWAVERAKLGYIQMGELAYHVAEQADGERTVGEIATAVTASLGRPVSAGDVQALIHTVLVPRGVVTVQGGPTQDGTGPDGGLLLDAPPRPDGRNLDGRSLDGQNGSGRGRGPRPGPSRPPPRERVIGRASLERLAAVLMWLLWPPVMLVVLGLSLAALSWLFAFHGLAGAVAEALTVPILLPVALLLALVAAGLGALGPMTALYSAGAQIERLRITPSLRQPGLTLDVTDDYGLSRAARLTVDAGGIYLQTVAALVLCLIGMFGGAEFLFLTVTLVTINILRLLLPFGRAGADRLLADVLLVPEPLLYAEQAMERLSPGNRELARTLPPLKRWGTVTIALYLVAAAVVLLLAGLVVLYAMPTVLASTVAALVAHVSDALGSLGERDAVRFFGGLLDVIVLTLTAFALAVAIVVGVGKLAAGVWAWSQTSTRRRLLAMAGACMALLLMIVFWAPVPRASAAGPPGTRTYRPLLGSPYRPLSSISRGTIFDLFSRIPEDTGSEPQSGEPPTVNNNIGTGVNQPLPGQATPAMGGGGSAGPGGAAGTGGSAGASGTGGAGGSAGAGGATTDSASGGPGTTTGTPGSRPAAAPDRTPGTSPGSGRAGAGGAGPATPAGNGPADGNPTGDGPAGTGPAGSATNAPAGPAPAVKPASGSASEPAAKPTGGSAAEPANKPSGQATSGPAPASAAKPTSGSAVQPANKPSGQTNTAPGSTGETGTGGNTVTINGSRALPTVRPEPESSPPPR
jgi:hypothetical protein